MNYFAWSNSNTLSIVSSLGENYKKLTLGSQSGLTVNAKLICFEGVTRGSKVISATIISWSLYLNDEEVYSNNEI